MNRYDDQGRQGLLGNQYANQMISAGALTIIDRLQACVVKQQYEWKAICGWDVAQSFMLYSADSDGNINNQQPIFRFKEKSNCCLRQVLRHLHPYTLKGFHYTGAVTREQDNYMDEAKVLFNMVRPYKTPFFCLCRPEMEVYHQEDGQTSLLGKIIHPWTCCLISIEIRGPNDEVRFYLEASCCQAIFLCRGCPFKECQTGILQVKNAQKEVLVDLLKETQGCCKACIGQGANFKIFFPPSFSKEDKALLVAAAIFLDYEYFQIDDSPVNA